MALAIVLSVDAQLHGDRVIAPAHGLERGRGASEALVRWRGYRVPKASLKGQACNGASSFRFVSTNGKNSHPGPSPDRTRVAQAGQ